MTEVQLKTLLQGVAAERGATVSCRDPSALEMLLRIGNADAYRGCVSAIFHSTTPADSSGLAGSAAASASAGAASGHMLFVSERYARRVEEEVQLWLDPFKAGASAATAAVTTGSSSGNERKRRRSGAEVDDESDSEDEFSSESDSD